MPTPHEVVEALSRSLRAPGDTVVFCGAGVSCNSGLPLVSQLVPALLDRLPLSAAHRARIWDGAEGLTMPFEAFVEALQKNSVVDPLYEIFAEGQPNTTHKLLARLMREGAVRTICTTNFDLLLERALAEEGWREGREYAVLFREEEFERVDWTERKPRLIKIHGGVQDKERMAITLEQIAQERLLPGRQAVLDHLFAQGDHQAVLVLGYSASDVFDITPHIQAIAQGHKRVVFVEHAGREDVRDLTEKESHNPFKKFVGSHRLYCDTDTLVERLWPVFCPDEPYALRRSTTRWQDHVEEWDRRNRAAPPVTFDLAAAGYLLVRKQDYEEALGYWTRAADRVRGAGDPGAVGRWLGKVGLLHQNLQEYDKALDLYLQALARAEEAQDGLGRIVQLSSLGNLAFGRGDYDEAGRRYRSAQEIAHEISHRPSEGALAGDLGNVALAVGDFDEAQTLYEEALDMAREIGDKDLECYMLENLGSLHSRTDEIATAAAFYEQAFDVAHHLGDLKRAGRLLAVMARLRALGESEVEGLTDEESVRHLIGSVGQQMVDKAPKGSLLAEVSEIMLPVMRDVGAMTFELLDGQEPREVDLDTDDDSALLAALMGRQIRGELCRDDEDWTQAREHFAAALLLARRLEEEDEELELLQQLGFVCGQLREVEQARQHYEQALLLALELEEEDAEAEIRRELADLAEA